MDWLPIYLLPLLPIATRGSLCLCFRVAAKRDVPDEALQQAEHRSSDLVLAGFAFTGLLGIVAMQLQSPMQPHHMEPLIHLPVYDLRLPLYFQMCSFIALIFSANFQGYKKHHWQVLLSSALWDSGTLSLLFSMLALLDAYPTIREYIWPMLCIATLTWISDHGIRLWKDTKIMRGRNK